MVALLALLALLGRPLLPKNRSQDAPQGLYHTAFESVNMLLDFWEKLQKMQRDLLSQLWVGVACGRVGVWVLRVVLCSSCRVLKLGATQKGPSTLTLLLDLFSPIPD